MKWFKRIILLGGTVSTFLIGYRFASHEATQDDTHFLEASPQRLQNEIEPIDNYTLPSYQFSEPFNAREALDFALSIEDATERYGRMIAIGCLAAQQNPEENLALLSPEIWEYANYDLRGAFHSEWMRSNPETFLPYAEAKYQELQASGQLLLFPSYHLSYMEPIALLELLPRIQNPQLKSTICNDLLGTLVELAPSLLWKNRDQIASIEQIIDEATRKSLYDLALQFWELSEWKQMPFSQALYTYMAENQLLDQASRLAGYPKTRFAIEYATQHSAAAAQWVREQGAFSEIAYTFGEEHARFFASLFATEGFSSWEHAPTWICEGVSADGSGDNRSAIFSAVQACPESCHLTRIKNDFFDYLSTVNDHDAIKQLYLSVENDHPILSVLERYMLQSGQDFSDALVARTTRQSPTPERLMRVLEMGNLNTWPDAYFAAARDTLNSLSDDELLWSLSPSMILSAQEITPQRIQNLLSNADPTWLYNTLNSYEFISNTSIENLPQLPNLLRDLPEEKSRSIIESARSAALRKSLFAQNKSDYLKIAKTQNEVLIVASGIPLDTYLSDNELKKTIEENPHRDDIYLTIANNAQFSGIETEDPQISQALNRIKTGQELSQKGSSVIVSTIQSLPTSERFLTAKAVLMASNHRSSESSSEKLINLPIWSPAEREQLQILDFTRLVNHNIDFSTEIIW